MEFSQDKKTMLSMIKPTGHFTLGNYLGALRNWVNLQDEYNSIFAVADLHAITIRLEPKALRQQTLTAYGILNAIGLDPKKSLMFIQSTVPQHAELSWILSCYSQYGEMQRMTQFKDKSQKAPENVNLGLFSYPSLMNADILLYGADVVPVGVDQKQHVELCRTVANRFNGLYGETFKIPEPIIPKVGAKIMSLQNPLEKMGKSDSNENAYVKILDDPDTIMRKFKRAVTDSEASVCMGENKHGVNNLIGIYSTVTGKSIEVVEAEFQGKGYGDFKLAVGEAVADELAPIKAEYDRIISDKAELERIFREGDQRAEKVARKTYFKAMKKVGFVL